MACTGNPSGGRCNCSFRLRSVDALTRVFTTLVLARRRLSRGLSASDVSTALGAQNVVLPTGTQKIGELKHFIGLNANAQAIEELNSVPVTVRDGKVIYIRDVFGRFK